MLSSNIAIVAVYGAVNCLLILVLACVVGHNRGRLNALEPGATGDATLTRAIRAHGNATEFIPAALFILLTLALLSAPSSLLHLLGGGFTAGRIAQAIGMMRRKHPNAIRFVGNLFTGLVYLLGSGSLVYYALVS